MAARARQTAVLWLMRILLVGIIRSEVRNVSRKTTFQTADTFLIRPVGWNWFVDLIIYARSKYGRNHKDAETQRQSGGSYKSVLITRAALPLCLCVFVVPNV